ncbi:unnamed protein product [Brachionus calyciflorus]|uniref:Uncharacterized protein n=1 Tax=Brachionus calyciflorus TaxID=104777 RepID=A0A814JNJ6_9BILA|nr:unnamed protein product [Brachionus calyciflorus]
MKFSLAFFLTLSIIFNHSIQGSVSDSFNDESENLAKKEKIIAISLKKAVTTTTETPDIEPSTESTDFETTTRSQVRRKPITSIPVSELNSIEESNFWTLPKSEIQLFDEYLNSIDDSSSSKSKLTLADLQQHLTQDEIELMSKAYQVLVRIQEKLMKKITTQKQASTTTSLPPFQAIQKKANVNKLSAKAKFGSNYFKKLYLA